MRRGRGGESRYLCSVMKTQAHRASAILSLLLWLVIAASCEQAFAGASVTGEEVEIRVDWSACRERPHSMTVLIYKEDGSLLRSKTTPETDHIRFLLPEGTYLCGVFSYSLPEWESLSLQGLERWDEACALPSEAAPSLLACAGDTMRTGKPLILHPREVVFPLRLEVRIDGIRHLGNIHGSLSPACGMPLFAAGEVVVDGAFPLPASDWVCEEGAATISRNILGSPERLETLHLSILLPGGKVAVDTTLDIRGQVRGQLSKGYALSVGDFALHSPGGGFEARIEAWLPGEETEFFL